MTTHPIRQSYGKSRIRLSCVSRNVRQHEFIEIVASIALDGDFAAAYAAGNNQLVVATDTMKNTVYALANKHGVASIESFSLLLAQHFLDTYPQITKAIVSLEERPWTRMNVTGHEHPHSFVGVQGEKYCCGVETTRSAILMRSGFTGLQVLKTTGSAFSGFHRDQYTTLPETEDRIFATTIEAKWSCADLHANWKSARQSIRTAMLKVFADNFSQSVQATLFQMACAALAECSLIDEISITLPNQHHLLANLAPLGMTNNNTTFIPTDEPFGLISAVVRRSETEVRT